MIADIERLIEKMVQEEFASLPARLVLVQKKKRKSVGDGEEEPEPKRTRTVLSPLGRQFIDKFLPTYISLSGDDQARKRLYKDPSPVCD